MTDKIVEVIDVSKIYGSTGHKAVDRMHFSLQQGETFGLVGESGSGKSTTGKMLVGLEQPSQGAIHVNGVDVTALKGRKEQLAFRKEIQMVFQDPYSSLNPRMTVKEIIGGPLKVHGLVNSKAEMAARVNDLLTQVGLDPSFANRYPREFSGGQCQRIGIARALALEPKVMILDEAIAALDVSIQAQVVNLLRQLKRERNLTYLFITHDLSMVRYISDRIGVMSQGRLVEIAPADAIYHTPLHPYTESLLSAIPEADPLSEKDRVRKVYEGLPYTDAQLMELVTTEIGPNHFILCHPSEVAAYKAKYQALRATA